jgi:hypothetical protein
MARGLRLGVMTVLALSMVWSTTPRFEAHAHAFAGPHVHGHDQASGQATHRSHGPAHPDTGVADHPDSPRGDPPEEGAPDSGASWHVHAGILLSGAALGPVEWNLPFDGGAAGGRFPALRSIARATGAMETPLRPPRLLS